MPKFEKGHKKLGGIVKGQKANKTLLKEAMGITGIEQLKKKTLENLNEFLDSTDKQTKMFATKEVAKYNFPQKREHSGEINTNVTVNCKY